MACFSLYYLSRLVSVVPTLLVVMLPPAKVILLRLQRKIRKCIK